jgi:methionyl aminopeptidase
MLHRDPLPIIKPDAEIARMRVSGRMVADVLALLATMVKPGTTTGDLNEAAHNKMKSMGGEPSFLHYRAGNKEPYPAVVCISIDEEIVHGIPGRCHYRGTVTKDRTLKEGELISIDCGVKYDGFHGDSAVTLPVGAVAAEKQKLMDVCRESLWAGIRVIKPGVKLSEIAASIEGSVRTHPESYGIVEEYVGHGIGRSLHESPQIPNFAKGVKQDYVLKKGYVIAIEPMINLGTRKTQELSDGWTVVTRDRKPSAHFEHTIAVTDAGFEVLTLRTDGQATH